MNATTEAWTRLLNQGRRKWDSNSNGSASSIAANSPEKSELRTEIERDYDRILFSTPVRRLADKTQVFPLDKNDSVRRGKTAENIEDVRPQVRLHSWLRAEIGIARIQCYQRLDGHFLGCHRGTWLQGPDR